MQRTRGCERFLRPPWVAVQPESRELLAVCLRKIRGLNKVKLIDAGFIWTEPHSKRIKVRLTIQKEVFSGVVLQQVFPVEFIVTNMFCDDCHAEAASNTWKACVQVRQRVPHKRTILYLEQLIQAGDWDNGPSSSTNQYRGNNDGNDSNFGDADDGYGFGDTGDVDDGATFNEEDSDQHQPMLECVPLPYLDHCQNCQS